MPPAQEVQEVPCRLLRQSARYALQTVSSLCNTADTLLLKKQEGAILIVAV